MTDSRKEPNPLRRWQLKKHDLNLTHTANTHESVLAYRTFPMQHAIYAVVEKQVESASPTAFKPKISYAFTRFTFDIASRTHQRMDLFSFKCKDFLRSADISSDRVVALEQFYSAKTENYTLRQVKIFTHAGKKLAESKKDFTLVDVHPNATGFVTNHLRRENYINREYAATGRTYLKQWHLEEKNQLTKKLGPKSLMEHVTTYCGPQEGNVQIDRLPNDRLLVNGTVITPDAVSDHVISKERKEKENFLCQMSTGRLMSRPSQYHYTSTIALVSESKTQPLATASHCPTEILHAFPACNGNVVVLGQHYAHLYSANLTMLESVHTLQQDNVDHFYRHQNKKINQQPNQRRHPDDWTDVVCTNDGAIHCHDDLFNFFLMCDLTLLRLRKRVAATAFPNLALSRALLGIISEYYVDDDVLGPAVCAEQTALMHTNLLDAIINELENRDIFPIKKPSANLFAPLCSYVDTVQTNIALLRQQAAEINAKAENGAQIDYPAQMTALKNILVTVVRALAAEPIGYDGMANSPVLSVVATALSEAPERPQALDVVLTKLMTQCYGYFPIAPKR